MAAAQSPWIEDVAEADFQRRVIDRSRELPVVVDFWAAWCGPCKQLGPVLEALAEEYGGAFVLAKVDCDAAPNLMLALQVQSIPLVIAFRDGQPTRHFMGALPEAQVRAWLAQALPGLEPKGARKAPEPAARLDPARAEAQFREKLAADEHDEQALVGLARLLLEHGEEEEAGGLLERVEPAGEQAEERQRLLALLFVRRTGRPFGDPAEARRRAEAEPASARKRYELGAALCAAGKYEEGLAELLAAARADRALARGEVKELMVQAFYAVGPRSELANRCRQELTLLLY